MMSMSVGCLSAYQLSDNNSLIGEQNTRQSVSANFPLPKIRRQSSADPKNSADLRLQTDRSAARTSGQ